MSEPIEDCPFCGARVEIHRDKSGEYVWHPIGAQCFLDGTWAPITHWNRRAAPALSKEVREALEYYESRHGDYDESQRHKAYIRSFLSASTKGK